MIREAMIHRLIMDPIPLTTALCLLAAHANLWAMVLVGRRTRGIMLDHQPCNQSHRAGDPRFMVLKLVGPRYLQ